MTRAHPDGRVHGQSAAAGPQLLAARAWLISDAAVDERLRSHGLLPVANATHRRHARLLAHVLGMRALPSAGSGSIADVDLELRPQDRSALARSLKLAAQACDDALTRLVMTGVLVATDEAGIGRISPEVVTSSVMASAVRWPAMYARLTTPVRDGSLAALMLFRVLADRVPHPAASIELPLREPAEALGLSDDQVRRGARALLELGCWTSVSTPGRATRYAIHADYLWSPGVTESAAVAEARVDQAQEAAPPLGAAAQASISQAKGFPESAAATDRQGGPADAGGWTMVIPPGVRFALPAEARDADVAIDPAGNLVVRISRT